MIVEILMSFSAFLAFLIWYLSKRMNTIKTKGTCKEIYNATRGCQGIFEYEVDGSKYYNIESSSHIRWLKEEKNYTIYVKNNNHNIFVSSKVISDLLFFVISFGLILLGEIYMIICL